MAGAGWERRRQEARLLKFQNGFLPKERQEEPSAPKLGDDPLATYNAPVNVFDPEKQQHTGVVLGIAMASFRTEGGEDRFRVLPGDDVKIAFLGAGQRPDAKADDFTVVDFYESKMAEYDATFAFVPISKLQELRGTVGMVNYIQIKLKPGVDGDKVRDKLRAAFGDGMYRVETWRDRQGPLLAAVQMERRILNLLLFMIIAVAGFGILAIFYMIVVEKTRDIGILKSLGASGRGVMGIFLGYGLLLGLVGSGMGLVAGLLVVRYLNEIAAGLGRLMGHSVFDPSIYYFYKIPAIVVPQTVVWIVGGALAIAVAASILPAQARPGCIRWRPSAMSNHIPGAIMGQQPRGLNDAPPAATGGHGASHSPHAHFHRGAAQVAPREQLRTIGLHKSYHKGSIEVPVLCGVSMSVRQGEFLAIVGQSGSGKSTLLHLLGTLDAPDRGEIHYEGKRIDNLPVRARDALRNGQFGMIFQFYHLLPELTTLENVLMPLMIAHGGVALSAASPHVSRRRRRTAQRGRLEPPAATSPPRAIRGGNAAGGHRPGAGGPAQPPPGRRAHRESRSDHRPGNHPHAA